mgnify:CR=1 FL=1
MVGVDAEVSGGLGARRVVILSGLVLLQGRLHVQIVNLELVMLLSLDR